MNTGGKYDSKAFKKSVGLNGVGVKAVNALSSRFEVRSYRDGKVRIATFSKGNLLTDETLDTEEESGTYIFFEPDATLFLNYSFRPEFIETMLRNYTYLNTGLAIIYNGPLSSTLHTPDSMAKNIIHLSMDSIRHREVLTKVLSKNTLPVRSKNSIIKIKIIPIFVTGW